MNVITSLVLGVIAATVLAVSWPVWILIQWGGPKPFSILWLPVMFSFLWLATLKSEVSSVRSAILSGLVFGLPVAGFCWYLPNHEEFIRRHHGIEMGWLFVASLIIPVVSFFFAAAVRSRKSKIPRSE